LASSFQLFTEFKSDASLQRVPRLLCDISECFDCHYKSIQESIIEPLLKFVADIKTAEHNSRIASHNYHQYTALLEQFVQDSTSRRKSDQGDLLGRVQKAHWDAVRSDFEYARSLDLIHAKKLLEVAIRVFDVAPQKISLFVTEK
jgi:hypothetical protein